MRPVEGDEVDEYFVRGQYGEGTLNGKSVPGYREEPMVDPKIQIQKHLLQGNF